MDDTMTEEEKQIEDELEIKKHEQNTEDATEIDETKVDETKKDEVVDETKTRKSAIDWIKKKMSGKKEEVETEGTDIPDEFSNAATEAGWSDDEVREFAEKYPNEELKDMIPYLKEEKTETKKETKDEKVEEKKVDDDIVARLEKRLAALEEGKAETDKKTKSSRETDIVTRVNQIFDDKSKEFDKVFGLTKDLPKFPAGAKKGQYIPTDSKMKVRGEVYSNARIFMATRGLGIDAAMAEALWLYKGKHLEKDVERKFIKDLKDKESELSGKRSRKEFKKTFSSNREEDIAYVKDLLDQKGQKSAT